MKRHNVLVYVHGTNGSGKSTLARAVIEAAGGVKDVRRLEREGKAFYTLTEAGVTMAGKYGNACGGVDGISPYALTHEVLIRAAIFPVACVMAEGLITPGVETCQKFASYFDKAVFIHINTPVNQCIKNVLKRRKEAGNTKPYDPANLHKKAHSAAGWARRLEGAGLDVRRLNYPQALRECLALFRLPPYDML